MTNNINFDKVNESIINGEIPLELNKVVRYLSVEKLQDKLKIVFKSIQKKKIKVNIFKN